MPCCRCPGAGKWVEGDGESRASYAQRTQVRTLHILDQNPRCCFDNTCFLFHSTKMGSSEIHNGMKRLTEKAEPAYAQQTHVRSLQLLDHACLMLSQQNKVSAVFKALDRGWTLKQTSHCRACRKTSKVILAWQVAVKVAVTSVNSFCLHPQSTCLLALWVCTQW